MGSPHDNLLRSCGVSVGVTGRGVSGRVVALVAFIGVGFLSSPPPMPAGAARSSGPVVRTGPVSLGGCPGATLFGHATVSKESYALGQAIRIQMVIRNVGRDNLRLRRLPRILVRRRSGFAERFRWLCATPPAKRCTPAGWSQRARWRRAFPSVLAVRSSLKGRGHRSLRRGTKPRPHHAVDTTWCLGAGWSWPSSWTDSTLRSGCGDLE